jgi:hypothetical protein
VTQASDEGAIIVEACDSICRAQPLLARVG